MNKETLSKILTESFRIEQDASSADYLGAITEDCIMNTEDEKIIRVISELSTNIYDKYKMESNYSAITSYIAETLLNNMTVEDIEYVLKAYSSPQYAKFFEIIGSVLDDYSSDITTMIDASLGVKTNKVLN